ncbi:MAG TPA: RNA polymerase factor sigma-54 [Syntrophomonas sp.]|nr:RNA polymerase factor sigma-54 [Syntrophomonas sp.]
MKLAPQTTQQQQLQLNTVMQHSLKVLSMNEEALSEYIRSAVDSNPLIEVEWSGSSPREGDHMSAYMKHSSLMYNIEEDLHLQLRMATNIKWALQVGEFLICSLNENGYLDTSIDEISRLTKIQPKRIKQVLQLIQSFDPAGVGARNLRECLFLQLKRLPLKNEIALDIVRYHFNDFVGKEFDDIAEKLNCTLNDVEKAALEIAGLNPRPISGGVSMPIIYKTPEILARIEEDELIVELLQRLPKLSVSALPSDYLRECDPIQRQRMKDHAQNARELIYSIAQRQRTLLRVSKQIVQMQRDFFIYNRPVSALTLADLSNELNICQSTVSRAISGKYLQFGNKIYSFKNFFPSRTASGNSSVQVKSLIKSLVRGEQPLHPLSDVQITRYFQNIGLRISRRTVTKYRNELGIAPAPERHPPPRTE